MRNIFWTILIIISSCEPDKRIEPDIGDCPSLSELISLLDYEDVQYSNGHFILTNDTGVFSASFNPINNNEIIAYYNGLLSSFTSDIIRYNLISGDYITILNSPNILSQPELSNNNWLLFTGSDFQIWKIKANGDSLTQLTSAGVNFECAWSPDGERFIYHRDFPSGIYTTVIADKNGNYLFSIVGGYQVKEPSWSPDGKYIACTNFSNAHHDIDIINTETWQITNLIDGSYSNDPNEQVTDIDFYPDSKHILWTTTKELRKTDIETGFTEVIATTCDSQGFSSASFSDNGQNILTKKMIYTYYDSYHLLIYSKHYLYSSTGLELSEIIIK